MSFKNPDKLKNKKKPIKKASVQNKNTLKKAPTKEAEKQK